VNYAYWFGIAIIVAFVLYVVIDGLFRYIDYVVELEDN
jgi:hypothetical protein